MVLENRVNLSESQVIKKEDLYTRWEHATKQEIAELCQTGKLRAFIYHKGPINGILFCIPTDVWYDGRWQQLRDEEASYFLLEDVERCEKEYPDFLGNIGVIAARNSDIQNGETASEDEEIQIDKIRKVMMMSPQDFVDFLNCRTPYSNRLITSWEEGFRESSIYNPYFMREHLQNEHLTVHRLDWENFQRQEKEEGVDSGSANIWSYATRRDELQTEKKDSYITELEANIKKQSDHIDELAFDIAFNLDPQISRQKKELEEKDARISELEKQVAVLEASNTDLSTTTRTQAATETRQEKKLGEWQAAFRIMIPVILQCNTDGPKKRTKTELQSMCSKHGGELTTTQLEFLRNCLPDEHVNREGGATIQNGPS